MKVGIIDYGVGNLGSVIRAFEELRVNPILIEQAKDVPYADCLVLPGVGNFSACKGMLDRGGWTSALEDEVGSKKKFILGICLGMQLLSERGSEGEKSKTSTQGLGFIAGKVESLKDLGCHLRVPHMGWNEIEVCNDSQLFSEIPDNTDFYFVHSYAFVAERPSDVISTTIYDIHIAAAVGKENIWGVQFHPEKSSKAGRKVLSNFLAMV